MRSARAESDRVLASAGLRHRHGSEQIDRMFVAFVTTKPMGLAWAFDLPLDHRSHGGELWRYPMMTPDRPSSSRCQSVKRAPMSKRSPDPVASAAENPSCRNRRRSLDARGANSLFRSVGLRVELFGSAAELLQPNARCDQRLVLDISCRSEAPRFPSRAGQGCHRDTDHLHHRSWRRANDGARDEGRRGRFPDQAVSRPRPA